MRRCKHSHCRNFAAKGRRECNTCKTQAYRKRNPERYTWQALKDNAKRRNIPFNLSFNDFLQFCRKFSYMKGKGIQKESLTIDRIIEGREVGYTKDNIQVLKNGDNVRKFFKFKYEWCEYDKEMKSNSRWEERLPAQTL